MAVKGLELFAERFAPCRDAFILIGGAACDLWFAGLNLEFRATRDLSSFLLQHSPDHTEWSAILQAIRRTVGGAIKPETLLSALRTFFQLDPPHD